MLMNIGNKFQISSNKLLTTVAFKINNHKMFCYEGSIFVAGSAIQWMRDKLKFFKQSKDTDDLYLKANDEENLIVVPAFTGLGAPHWKPNVRGAIFGLTRNTSKNELIKATLDKENKSVKFFHLGPNNDWKKILNKEISDEISERFEPEMKELGYL